MTKPPTSNLMVILSDERTGGRLAVEFRAFLKFSLAIDQDLKRLVAKWSHLAPPRASGQSRMVFTRKRQRLG